MAFSNQIQLILTANHADFWANVKSKLQQEVERIKEKKDRLLSATEQQISTKIALEKERGKWR